MIWTFGPLLVVAVLTILAIVVAVALRLVSMNGIEDEDGDP